MVKHLFIQTFIANKFFVCEQILLIFLPKRA